MQIGPSELLTIFIALFAIIDPFGGIPIFLSVTRGGAPPAKVALKSCLAAFLVMAAFIFAGRLILNFFGVSIPAFQIGGGIIIFLTGLPMLFAYPLAGKALGEGAGGEGEGDVSLVPLAVPMLAGPGAITTVMVLTDRFQFMEGKMEIAGVVLLVLAITFLLFWQAKSLFKLVGQTGLNFLTRIMGLILIVLAVQYILTGIKDFFRLGL
jgi:multiple antibiotic resistance protein